MGSSSKQKSTSTSTSTPWGPQGKELQYGFGQARNLYQNNPQSFYPGNTVAPFSGDTNRSFDMIRNIAGQPGTSQAAAGALTGMMNGQDAPSSFVDPSSRQYFQNATNGDYLNSNPYLDAMYDRAAGKVQSNMDSRFAGANRTMSGAHARGLGEGLGSLAENVYGNNYARERGMQQQAAGQLANLGQIDQSLYGMNSGNQLKAAALAPGIDQAQYTGAQMLNQIGAQQEQLNQDQINEQVNRHNFAQEEPWQRLERYMGLVNNGSFGGTTSSSTPMQRNRLGGALGGAMAGSQFGPWGMAGGAILGGLL